MSKKLTREEALALALTFRKSANAISSYTISNWDNLKKMDRDRLNGIERTLSNYSEDFINLAASLALDDLEMVLKEISNITKKANRVIKKIKATKTAISVSASLVALGGAIMSKNPGAIASSLQNAYKELQAVEREIKKA